MSNLNSSQIKEIRLRYPNRIPALIISKGFKKEESQLLLCKDDNISRVYCQIRKLYKLEPHETMFLFINNMLPAQSTTISQYDNGELLRIYMMKESSFGKN